MNYFPRSLESVEVTDVYEAEALIEGGEMKNDRGLWPKLASSLSFRLKAPQNFRSIRHANFDSDHFLRVFYNSLYECSSYASPNKRITFLIFNLMLIFH